MGIFRTSTPGGRISNDPGRSVQRRQEEEPGYMAVLQKRAGSLNI